MKQNYFIVFEGLDGSGKGEMLVRTHNYLFEKDKSIVILTTREPTNGGFGKEARRKLAKDRDPNENAEKMLELYVKDRAEHLKNQIEPFLSIDDGNIRIVLCDRYFYSTICYQHTQGLSWDTVISKNKDFLKPDLCLLLDVPENTALQRITDGRDSKEKFEKAEFMKELRTNFLQMHEFIDDNIVVIDAEKDKDAVFLQIKEAVKQLIS